MSKYKSKNLKKIKKPASKTLQLLILRILILLEGYKWLTEGSYFKSDYIVYAIGMGEWIDGNKKNNDEEFFIALKKKYHYAEKNFSYKLPKNLKKNIKQVSRITGLSKNEQLVFSFLILAGNDKNLSNLLEAMSSIAFSDYLNTISVVLAMSEKEAFNVISQKSRLMKSGLLKRHSINGLTLGFFSHVEFIYEDFPKHMTDKVNDVRDLFSDVFTLSGKPLLNIKHYKHMEYEVGLVKSYLSENIGSEKGKNILIYGPPGTGKTQLAKIIAKELNLLLFEVSSETRLGEGLPGIKRLLSLRVSQSILNNNNVIMLFDECDDMFGHELSLYSANESAVNYKGWVNKSLDENKLSCIWITNSLAFMEPAYIRRFDMVIEMKNPNRTQRKEMIKSLCGGVVSESMVSKLAESEALTPAVVKNAIQVAASLDNKLPGVKVEDTVVSLINSTLKAQGYKTLVINEYARGLNNYNPGLSNSDYNLKELKDGIESNGKARLCLYGPPGTGKTIFAHWLGEQLGKTVISKKASDLIASYLGETEANIAAAFDEAEKDNALLLFDEVDSFLQARSSAKNSWEITSVNELLTQIDNFNGIFVASTNLIDRLDEASMRRFDLKVKFDYLKTSQVRILIINLLKSMNLGDSDADIIKLLPRLDYLTPGDFRMLERRARFQPFKSIREIAEALIEINASKGGYHNPIGFVNLA